MNQQPIVVAAPSVQKERENKQQTIQQQYNKQQRKVQKLSPQVQSEQQQIQREPQPIPQQGTKEYEEFTKNAMMGLVCANWL